MGVPVSEDYVYHSWLSPWVYFEPGKQPRSLLTLKENHFMVLSFLVFTFALLITQARSWVILRSIVNIFTPLPLGGLPEHEQAATPRTSNPESRLELAKFRANMAMWETTKAMLAWCGLKLERSTKERLWPFGLLAFVNFCGMTVVGTLLPWHLTDQSEKHPVVLSKNHGACLAFEDRAEGYTDMAHVADSFYRQCWRMSLETTSGLCGKMPIIQDRMPTHILGLESCPWGDGSACKRENHSVMIEHRDIFSRDVGINTDLPLSLSHRLICSPLNLSQFIDDLDTGQPGISFADQGSTAKEKDQWSLPLSDTTLSRKSGLASFLQNRPWDLIFLPKEESTKHFMPEKTLRKKFRIFNVTDDELSPAIASVFFLGYTAGRTSFPTSVDDPLFSAHMQLGEGGKFFPDYEMTAVACAEQYQACVHLDKRRCLPWMNGLNVSRALFMSAVNKNSNLLTHDPEVKSQIVEATFKFLDLVIHYTSVSRYLHVKRGTQVLLAGLGKSGSVMNTDWEFHPKRQWVKELLAWMEISVLRARFGFLYILQRNNEGFPVPELGKLKRLLNTTRTIEAPRSRLCGQLLLHDSTYTNIDALGLLYVVSGQAIVILLSYGYDAWVLARRVWAWLRNTSFWRDMTRRCRAVVVAVRVAVGTRAAVTLPSLQDVMALGEIPEDARPNDIGVNDGREGGGGSFDRGA